MTPIPELNPLLPDEAADRAIVASCVRPLSKLLVEKFIEIQSKLCRMASSDESRERRKYARHTWMEAARIVSAASLVAMGQFPDTDDMTAVGAAMQAEERL